MQWAWVQPLVQEIPHAKEQPSPCSITTELLLYSLWAATTEPEYGNYWSHHGLEPVLHNKRSPRNEKPVRHNEEQPQCLQHRPSATKHIPTGLPWGLSGKEGTCQCRRCKRRAFDPLVKKIPWSRNGNPLEYPGLGNPMDRRAQRDTIHHQRDLDTI